ncbi:MAG: PHP domain-containing protein [Kofleriaceae bacterium]
MIDLAEDMHVHSTFSDGRGSLADNVAAATAAGLARLGCVDHVRRDSAWLPAFVAAVREAQATTAIELRLGVEAKFLDGHGRLDVPADLAGVARVYAADHQVPFGDGCHSPRQVRTWLTTGEVTAAAIVTTLVDATLAAAASYPLVVAHLWSVLPKIGLSEDDVAEVELRRLADGLARAGAEVEIDEQWSSPGIRTARVMRDAGVQLRASSDAHLPERIGVYAHVRDVERALGAGR